MEFRGTYTALVTPFRSGAVDMTAYSRLLGMQKDARVTGVVPCGCTGEAATLSGAERRKLLEATLELAGDDLQVIAGTGTNSTETSITLTQQAEAAGAHAAMLITPYYNKPSQDGLINHYRRIGDATKIPLILYNVPGRTAVTLEPGTISELFATGRYLAVKEAGGSIEAVSNIRAASGICVLSGDDSLTVPMMSLGAQGVVSVVSNMFPGAVREMVASALAGDFARASALHFQLLPVMRAAFVESNPSPIKAMLSLGRVIENEVRAPLSPVNDDSMAVLRRALDGVGSAGSL